LDRRDKIPAEEFAKAAAGLGLDEVRVGRFEQICRLKYPVGGLQLLREHTGLSDLSALADLDAQLRAFGLEPWCEYDLGIVRGLAYYTGTVFEVHEVSGMMRAMAGGGRYDQLIELFGGPSMPGVGMGMGDVVLSEVLMDKGLMPEDVSPRPDVYVFALTDAGAARLPGVVANLRRQGLHARMSYKAGRNVGKLIKDADAARARFALILDDQVKDDLVSLKELKTGSQAQVAIADLIGKLRQA
jgi:histidyl-tRNA synthetase